MGNTTILMVINHFSNACHLIPLPKLPVAFETVELLCNYVLCFYELPEDVIPDCWPQFTSRVWTAFFKLLEINISLISSSDLSRYLLRIHF